MKYAIYWQDRRGEERPTKACSTIFESVRKATAYCKLLNDQVRIKGTGQYVVVEL